MVLQLLNLWCATLVISDFGNILDEDASFKKPKNNNKKMEIGCKDMNVKKNLLAEEENENRLSLRE